MFKIFGGVVLTVALSACGAPRPRPTPAPGSARLSSQTLPAAGHYRIDGGQSELRLLVYRAGPMARFGHNHVMVNRDCGASPRPGLWSYVNRPSG